MANFLNIKPYAMARDHNDKIIFQGNFHEETYARGLQGLWQDGVMHFVRRAPIAPGVALYEIRRGLLLVKNLSRDTNVTLNFKTYEMVAQRDATILPGCFCVYTDMDPAALPVLTATAGLVECEVVIFGTYTTEPQ